MLGAECVQVPVALSGREVIADLAQYLSNWFDLIAIRSPSLEQMTDLARRTKIPVLNLRTRQNHPCEILGDLSFIKETGRSLRGLSVVAVCAAGNIVHSWAEAASVYPLTLMQIAPKDFWIDERIYSASRITRTEDLSAISGADVVITDCWPCGDRASNFSAFQITGAVLDDLKPNSLFLPCPPVTRGQEVSEDAMTHEKCMVFQAKSHLLHAQNACLEAMLLRQF